MKVIEIELKNKTIFRVNISDRQNISKLLYGLDVEKWEIITNGIHSLTDFNKFKKRMIENK